MVTFSKDIRHYHPTPRTLQTSKFGPYATMGSAKPASRPLGIAVDWFYNLFFAALAVGILAYALFWG